jgi:ubiquinone/menaquinone biosynthesis C-methylase UbiE
MNKKLINILCCPDCKENLSLKIHKVNQKDGEILEGKLICQCGRKYPIIKGVPVMTLELKRDMEKIKSTFSKEWKVHKYKKTRTWGFRIDQRKRIFLKQMGIKNEKILNGKLLLDAGCGNGELTISLSDYGFDFIIGMDLSDSIFEAYNYNSKKDSVFFIQGDLMNPPFQDKTFDYVYSDGVIHHTYDTRYSFSRLAKITKKNGRLWIWVYLKMDYVKDKKFKKLLFHYFQTIFKHLPLFFQTFLIYTTLLPLATILQWLKIIKPRGNWREKVILISDAFTHLYEYTQTPKEVDNWFKEEGFKHIELTDNRHGGFGMYGIKNK